MRLLPDGCVDAVITDPPYGVNLTGKLWHSTNRGKTVKSAVVYDSYEDTRENFIELVLPRLSCALGRARCAAIFMADKTLPLLPPWVALGGIFSAAGTGLGSWGFQCFMHCAFYGRDPYLAAGLGSRPTGRSGIWPNDSNGFAHPCAKPIDVMVWAVDRASLEGNTILDPFLGSGTTAVAALKLGRHFLGFEISEEYCRIARERIALVEAQPNLFETKPEWEQRKLSI